jgi:hypothetical protein
MSLNSGPPTQIEWAKQAETNSFSEKHPLPQHLFLIDHHTIKEEKRRKESNPATLLQNARHIKMSLISKKKGEVKKPKINQLGLICQGLLLVPNSKSPPLVKSKVAEGKGAVEKPQCKDKEPVKFYESLPTFLIMPPPAMSPTSSESVEEIKTKSVSPRLKKFLSRFSSKS